MKYLDYLNDPCFSEVNRFFILNFQNKAVRIAYSEYLLLKAEIKGCNIIIDEAFYKILLISKKIIP